MEDVHVAGIRPLLSPAILLEESPCSPSGHSFVNSTRATLRSILSDADDRFVVIVGPCSIHDPKAAIEYGEKLREIAEKYKSELCVVMRVYFEKPRTSVGWKGLINDPDLDGTFKINKGLRIARQIMVDLTEMGVACAAEFLDTISPQFISDLVAWAAIGARTTESQVHRQLASGVSMPVGFKNGTAGSIDIAANAIISAAAQHCFLGVTKQGVAAIITTNGNKDCHVILRGSSSGPNYSAEHVKNTKEMLKKAKVTTKIMVDCSHDNAQKNHANQPSVARAVAEQVAAGDYDLFGVMIESNIVEGRQDLKPGCPLEYGKSITDACVNLETTDKMLAELAAAVRARREKGRP